jgi:hypothetical protein
MGRDPLRANGIMASGTMRAKTGRTHGRTNQQRKAQDRTCQRRALHTGPSRRSVSGSRRLTSASRSLLRTASPSPPSAGRVTSGRLISRSCARCSARRCEAASRLRSAAALSRELNRSVAVEPVGTGPRAC